MSLLDVQVQCTWNNYNKIKNWQWNIINEIFGEDFLLTDITCTWPSHTSTHPIIEKNSQHLVSFHCSVLVLFWFMFIVSYFLAIQLEGRGMSMYMITINNKADEWVNGNFIRINFICKSSCVQWCLELHHLWCLSWKKCFTYYMYTL